MAGFEVTLHGRFWVTPEETFGKKTDEHERNIEGEKKHFEATKSRIIRLSNVVLKREWEQVKHAR